MHCLDRFGYFTNSLRCLVFAGLLLGLSSSPVLADLFDTNTSVGIYADPAGTTPCITIPAGEVGTFYIVATTAGMTAVGFTGAEFRIEVSNPEGYIFSYKSPSAANIVIGNPMDLIPDDDTNAVGLNVVFPECQTLTSSAGDRISLGSVVVVNIAGGPTRLSIKRRTPPTNSNLRFPLLTACDGPLFTATPMQACSGGPTGEVIAAVATLNDSICGSSVLCSGLCEESPGILLRTRRTPDVACVGDTVVLEAIAFNTGVVSESIDFFVDGDADLSFESVEPGDSVVVVRRVVIEECLNPGTSFLFGVVARTASCPIPAGREALSSTVCSTRNCDDGSEGCAAVRLAFSYQVVAGEEFSVEVLVGAGAMRARDVFGVTGRIRYSRPDLVEFVGFTCKNEDGSPMDLGEDVICFAVANDVSGYVDFAVTMKSGLRGRYGDLRIGRAVFRLPAEVGGGFCSTITLAQVRIVDPGGRSLCYELRSSFSRVCTTSPCRVWPGDTNRDGVVNALDLETLAGFWGEEGPARILIRESCLWEHHGEPLAVDCWHNYDAAWSDAFGDGRVGVEDVLCIGVNWGRTHSTSGQIIQSPPIEPAVRKQVYEWMLDYMGQMTDGDESVEEARQALSQMLQEIELPRATVLHQNIPNPFNPNTRIEFSMAASGHARIDVFDVTGRRVRTLVDRDLQSGDHFTTWDGTRDTGEQVASGIYYTRAQLGEDTFTHKMVLAR